MDGKGGLASPGSQTINGENKHQPVYREKPVYSTSFRRVQKVRCVLLRYAVVDGDLVSYREVAFAPLHSDFYVS